MSEKAAWYWLLKLPKLDPKKHSYTKCDCQIRVYICPGKLHEMSGAPLVKITYQHPNLNNRLSGRGNSLFTATHQLHQQLWTNGIKTEPPELLKIKQN